MKTSPKRLFPKGKVKIEGCGKTTLKSVKLDVDGVITLLVVHDDGNEREYLFPDETSHRTENALAPSTVKGGECLPVDGIDYFEAFKEREDKEQCLNEFESDGYIYFSDIHPDDKEPTGEEMEELDCQYPDPVLMRTQVSRH